MAVPATSRGSAADPDGKLRKDSNGQLVFKLVGKPITVGHGGAPGVKFFVQRGYLFADSGARIEPSRTSARILA
jgi:hypothetical protein